MTWLRAGRGGDEAGQSLTAKTHRADRAKKLHAFDVWAVRVGSVIAVVYLATSLLVGPGEAVTATVVIVVLLWLARFLLGDRERLIAAGSTVVSVLLVSLFLGPARSFTAAPVGLISYVLLFLALVAPFVPSRAFTDRGVTVVLGQAGVLLATVLGQWLPWVSAMLGLVWVLALMVVRGPGLLGARVLRARAGGVRSHPLAHWGPPSRARDDDKFQDAWVQAGAAAEIATAAELGKLPPTWQVMHSRSLPGTRADLDHLAIGPGGLFVLDSKDWAGTISERRQTDPTGEPFTTYTFNGREDWLVDRLKPVVFEARRAAWALLLPPEHVTVAVVFSERMRLPSEVVRLQILNVWDSKTKTTWDPVVYLMARDQVVPWLVSWPAVAWRRPGPVRRWVGRRRGLSDEQVQLSANARFMRDLAAVADEALPPKV